MTKPSILIVPGSFALPDSYDAVVAGVRERGYEISALNLPTVAPRTGPRPGARQPTMYDDAASIAQAAASLADQGKDVILVAHSYGGIPMTESTKGLGKGERQAQNKPGGIVRLAYMAASVRMVGKSAADVPADDSHADSPDQEFTIDVDDNGWLYAESIPTTAAVVFSDLPQDQGEEFAKLLSRHSPAAFDGVLTHAGYKDIPTSYLVCEDDLVVPATRQRGYIALIEKESRQKVDVTSINTGHGPNASAPQKVVDWIVHVAELAQKQM